MLFLSTSDTGNYLDEDNYTVEDVSLQLMIDSLDDVKAFLPKALVLLEAHNNDMDYEQLGHDFWLTRNSHGDGFWDRDLGELGDQLTELSKGFTQVEVYVSDDNEICSWLLAINTNQLKDL